MNRVELNTDDLEKVVGGSLSYDYDGSTGVITSTRYSDVRIEYDSTHASDIHKYINDSMFDGTTDLEKIEHMRNEKWIN